MNTKGHWVELAGSCNIIKLVRKGRSGIRDICQLGSMSSSDDTSCSDISSTSSEVHAVPPSIQRGKNRINIRKQTFQRRIIKSKAVVYILIVNALQSFSFILTTNAVFREILVQRQATLAMTFVIGIQTGGLSALFFPIGGVLGDVYLGRHFISVVCIFVSFFSTVVLSFALSVYQNVQESKAITVSFELVIPLSALLILAICDGVFEVNWLTFGADQMIDSPSEEVSSYIYWWSWTKNFGLVVAILVNTVIRVVCAELSNYTPMVAYVMPSIAPLISSIACAASLFIDNKANSLYDTERVNVNPIKQIFGVLYNACTSRPKPVAYTSAFRYGEDPPSGLDFAREHHDGKYTDEQVENVKSFGRILVMIVAISGYYCVYLAFHNKAATELHESINYVPKHNWEKEMLVSLRGSLDSLVDSSLYLLLLPLWNHVVFPLLGHYAPNARKRIGFGSVIGVIGMLVAVIIHLHDQTSASKLYCVPLVLIVVAESMVLVPALEFIYAQSPDNMKGLLIGFHYFLIGVWATVVALSLNLIPDFQRNNENYFLCYFGVGVFGLLFFLLISCHYRNRKRNDPITDIMRISSYYSD